MKKLYLHMFFGIYYFVVRCLWHFWSMAERFPTNEI